MWNVDTAQVVKMSHRCKNSIRGKNADLIQKLNGYQWKIREFPNGRAPTLRGTPTYYSATFSRKLNENKVGRIQKFVYVDPSATGHKSYVSRALKLDLLN